MGTRSWSSLLTPKGIYQSGLDKNAEKEQTPLLPILAIEETGSTFATFPMHRKTLSSNRRH